MEIIHFLMFKIKHLMFNGYMLVNLILVIFYKYKNNMHSLGVEVGTKTGNYDTIGPYNYTVTARMLTIWIDHGLGPYTLDYNYMILPNVSC